MGNGTRLSVTSVVGPHWKRRASDTVDQQALTVTPAEFVGADGHKSVHLSLQAFLLCALQTEKGLKWTMATQQEGPSNRSSGSYKQAVMVRMKVGSGHLLHRRESSLIMLRCMVGRVQAVEENRKHTHVQ
jgi:hypothetical protein